MTTLELNSYKMELVREIVNNFNSIEALHKLANACRLIRKEETEATIPDKLFIQLMENGERQIAAGEYVTDEEFDKIMAAW